MIKPDNATIIELVNSEVTEYEGEKLIITDKVDFSQHETIKKIVQHQNNGFSTKSNKKRFFFNIGNSRIDTAVKKIDFDTKDVSIENTGGAVKGENLLVQAENRQYMYQNHLGTKFNDIVEQYPDAGNVIAKKVNTDEIFEIANLANIKVIDQSAKTLEDTAVIEEHIYNASELRRMNGTWDNVDVALKSCNSNDGKQASRYHVYERYGEMSLNKYKEAKGLQPVWGGDDKYINTFSISAIQRPNSKQFIKEHGATNGVLMFCEEFAKPKSSVYKTLHWGAYQGRFWRKGLREALFPYQERVNILGNQIYQALKWSSLHLLWSRDTKLAGRNIFKALENGQILQAEDLNILDLAERNLTAQVNEWNRLMDMADRETQAFEVATGERLPSGTTLGQVELQTSSVGQFYQYKREKLGLFLEDIYNGWIMPDLLKKINAEHILKVTGSTSFLEDFYRTAAEGWVANNWYSLDQSIPFDIHVEQKALELMKQGELSLAIQKDMYKNMKLKARVVISGESTDRQNKINNGLALLNIIQDPMQASQLATELASYVGYKLAKPNGLQQPAGGQINQTGANGGQSLEALSGLAGQEA